MSRIKDLRKVVGDKLRESITDAEKLESAYAHLYGVSLAATVIAEKRGENSELASMTAMLHDIAAYVSGTYDDHAHRGADMVREILLRNALAKPGEIDIICSAIYHHDDKLVKDEPMDEGCRCHAPHLQRFSKAGQRQGTGTIPGIKAGILAASAGIEFLQKLTIWRDGLGRNKKADKACGQGIE